MPTILPPRLFNRKFLETLRFPFGHFNQPNLSRARPSAAPGQKFFERFRLAFCFNINRPVRLVSREPLYAQPLRLGFCRVSKKDALYLAINFYITVFHF